MAIKVYRPRSWQGFATALKKIRRQYGVNEDSRRPHAIPTHKPRLLFRGQSDARWELLTTLERRSTKNFDVLGYMILASSTTTEIESFTDARWRVPQYPNLKREIDAKSDAFRVHIPNYDYLVYLRHHGFPSPLLDWTESAYIAAYFAYMTPSKLNPAVFCYLDTATGLRGGSAGHPKISLMGPFVRTHRRHFAQKAWYTVATRWDDDRRRHVFCRHDEVFRENEPDQDILIKIVLPARARAEALRELRDYNINHFTLFQSEDSLVKALESKHFDLADA